MMTTQDIVMLTDEQRSRLQTFVRSGTASARKLARARILLLADRSQGQALTDDQVAQATLVCRPTVLAVRHRFVQEGLEAALCEKPRPGRAPKITGDVEAKLTMLACSAPPEGHARWSLRLLADQMVTLDYVDEKISHVAIYKTLKKTKSSRGPSSHGALANQRRSL
jgi:hypothetical protein